MQSNLVTKASDISFNFIPGDYIFNTNNGFIVTMHDVVLTSVTNTSDATNYANSTNTTGFDYTSMTITIA